MSKIEWTNATWNIITGCTKHSEGCQNCYAETMHKRLTAMGQEKYKIPFNGVIFHYDELGKKIPGENKMVFVNSMSDTFNEKISDEQIDKILNACGSQSKHIFQVLTKRAERLPGFIYPKNIWLGVTVELEKYKNRIDYLRKTDAKIKFLSCEPLLGDLGKLDLSGIDWVICGGESGPKARPMHPDWVRNIQKQCKEQNVAFFFKQWGEFAPVKNSIEYLELPKTYWIDFNGQVTTVKKKIPSFLQYNRASAMKKIGKAKTGALLDGVEYKEFPNYIVEFGEMEE